MNVKRIVFIQSIILLTSIKAFSQGNDLYPDFEISLTESLHQSELRKPISYYLGKYVFVTEELAKNCETQYGEFKFRVNEKGIVDSLILSGNLRPFVVKKISDRIWSSSGRWKFTHLKENLKSYWFTYPFYQFVDPEASGCFTRGNASQTNLKLTYNVLFRLPYNSKGLLKIKDGYLIEPGSTEPYSKR
ncbi:hypothetical protein BWI96_08070 [Siphonobacter sp. SORGH_AS_0500]|uniref:hypothetical protein n=1 Tax=Siphonobacter sp. SORGH_AS_0500 TaxID=1864824 RepID=UPI000CAC5797|nr:hypothetical protein [Siphonobacter sp. SORGH_AS_0500]PKK37291.1 hypothetical protein BWI96_08070 [Siphonobacter sp. SORGH_AS_0500]